MKQLSLTFLALFLCILTKAQAPITGPSTLCDGTTITLMDATSGGTWSSSNPAVAAVVMSTGVVSGLTAGVATITYNVVGTGFVTHNVTVNPAPTSISGWSSICPGTTTTLTCGTTGGTWSSSSTTVATIGSSSGVCTGISAGISYITYTVGATGCYTTIPVSVNPAPSSLVGSGSVCTGTTVTWTVTPTGGTWTSSTPGVATISSGGVITGVSVGTSMITYALTTGCTATRVVSVDASSPVYTVSGGGSYCAGGAGLHVLLSGSTIGVSYQLYSGGTVIGAPMSGTGAPLDFGLLTLAGTYTVVASGTGCTTPMAGSAVITITSLPTISASASTTCGGITTLTGSGGVSYVWAPSTGLSCSTCSTTTMSPGSTTVFTLTGTDSYGCVNTGTVTVDGNRISGYITYTGSSSDTFRVWLVHYNPSDSSIIATDSTYSCMVSGTPYYEFMDEPSGSYMVKARLLGTVPGTSGYIPTYSLSTSTWSTAASVSHTTGFDTMHINMIYGTVPAGPGFISGFVYAGAGKGTTGDYPEPGMLVYLKDGSGNVLTYTYTDATGAYSFTGLGYGTYVIYPTEFDYYTTPSSLMTLSASVPSVTGTYFKKHTSYGTITPLTTACCALTTADEFSMYPNPTTGNLNIEWTMSTTGDVTVSIYDMTGREVYTTTQTVTGNQMQVGLNNLKDGVYQVHVAAATFTKNEKLLIQR